MNKYKAFLIALLLVTGYTLLFLVKMGWIGAITTSSIAIILGFLPYGGSFIDVVKEFRKDNNVK